MGIMYNEAGLNWMGDRCAETIIISYLRRVRDRLGIIVIIIITIITIIIIIIIIFLFGIILH